MIRIITPTWWGGFERIWFDENAKASNNVVLSRFLRNNSVNTNKKNCCIDSYTTVFSNLTESEEQLLSRMRKKVRYEVKRADKENILVEFFFSDDLKTNEEIIKEFESVYISFCEKINDKSVRKAYSRKRIIQYIDNRCLLISKGSKDGAVVFHLYVFDEKNSCLLFSASDFRDDGIDQYLTGRINKYLHFRDMLKLKEVGVENYDWGNLSSKENYNGIDNFKISFGGDITDGYNVLTSNNFIGNFLVALYKVKKRIGIR